MLPLRYSASWRVASIILLVLVLISTLMPAVWFWPDRSGLINWFVHVDKWLHGITFVFLAVWFAGQYRRKSYWRIGIGLLFFERSLFVGRRTWFGQDQHGQGAGEYLEPCI